MPATVGEDVGEGGEHQEYRKIRSAYYAHDYFARQHVIAYNVRMIIIRRMGRKPLNRSPINITLPKAMKAELESVANREGRTASSVVEELLRPYLAKAKLLNRRASR